MAKPTMQDIADALSTSRITVWKALNNREGVSEELRAQIRLEAEKIGYITAPTGTNDVRLQAARTISAVVSRPESSAFWLEIIHRIAKELALKGVNLMYTYLPTDYKEGYTLPAVLTDGSVEGMIVLNVYSEKLLAMLGALELPKVFLDTVPTIAPAQLNGDLVIIEGRSLVREITGRLLDKGLTQLGFVGDIDYAQTNTDRYDGFKDAFALRGLQPKAEFSMTEHIGLRTHYEEISRFLSGLSVFPQGFVCASDYIAHFIRRYCTEHGIDCESLVLTGFDNNTEYDNVAGFITTVDVQTISLGSRLANKALFAIENPTAPHEVSYITNEIIYRGIS